MVALVFSIANLHILQLYSSLGEDNKHMQVHLVITASVCMKTVTDKLCLPMYAPLVL